MKILRALIGFICALIVFAIVGYVLPFIGAFFGGVLVWSLSLVNLGLDHGARAFLTDIGWIVNLMISFHLARKIYKSIGGKSKSDVANEAPAIPQTNAPEKESNQG